MAARVKVIDLAKELGVTSKDLIVALEAMGQKAMRAMSPLQAATANELRSAPDGVDVVTAVVDLGQPSERLLDEVRRAVGEFVERYNAHWRLEKLGFQTPQEARQAHALKQAA